MERYELPLEGQQLKLVRETATVIKKYRVKGYGSIWLVKMDSPDAYAKEYRNSKGIAHEVWHIKKGRCVKFSLCAKVWFKPKVTKKKFAIGCWSFPLELKDRVLKIRASIAKELGWTI